ncbi:MAG: PAS domain S-box protein [Deltaproteobacteria bacterium]|nr:PAS domain S-box protein [Deltaproteobacteria bacterium]
MATPSQPEPVGVTSQSFGGQSPPSLRVFLLRIVLVATAYLGTAMVGKMLALDPFHASPMWPAAGLALAALLIWGSRLWPGVWLGAFLYNFLLGPSIAVIPLAAAVASGSTLAALLGARLTRRFFTPEVPLTESNLWRFLLLAGPLSCLVSATLGVVSLHLAGWLTTDKIVSQWLLWWVGDTVGVVLFAPILLSFWPRACIVWSGYRGRIALQLLIQALLLIAGHLGLDNLEEVQAEITVNDRMAVANELGFLHLTDQMRNLNSLERFLTAIKEVTGQEFATFTADIIRQPAIMAVDWAPRVAGNERQAFEATRQQGKGKGGYHIFEVDANDQEVKLGERSEYFPILFSATQHPLPPVLGLDHGFQEERRLAMARARDTGTITATRIVSQLRTDQGTIILFMPVYHQDLTAGVATVEERRMALRGFVVGLYEVKALFAALTQAADTRGLLFRVTDMSPGEPAQVLSSTLTAAATPAWHREIPFAGRTWQLELQPKTVVWQDGGSLQSRLYLGFSMVASLLVAFAVLGTAIRNTLIAASEQHWRDFAENIPGAVYVCELFSPWRMTFISRGVDAITGWTAEEFLADRAQWPAIILPEDQPRVTEAVARAIAGRTSFALEYRIRHRDGSERWIHAIGRPLFDASGRALHLEGNLFDITSHKDTEYALRQLTAELEAQVEERTRALTVANDLLIEQEEKLRATLDNLLDCVITINDQGVVQSVNQAVRTVLGYTPEELIGRNVNQLPAEPHGSHHDEYIARYLRTGDPHIIGSGRELEGRHRDGRLIPLELMINEFQSHGQRFFTGVLRDISERKRFIAELTKSREAAEQANHAKSIFLATMSHEIRTPMNGVIGMVEVLEHSTLTTSQADLVRTIRDSATNLLGLIDDILDFSKAEAGRLEMEQVPVALVELIEDLCQSLVPMVVEKGTRFDLFIAPDIPELVNGDALRLRQVFYNLLGNAIKFSDPGQTKQPGLISLRVEVAQIRPLQLLFRISDNGIGMTPETVAQLFTPFSQGEMSTTRRFGGTGLGLTICHRLVTIMGGNIAVESRPDEGTTFSVTLPFTAPAEQPHRSWPDLTGVDCLLADSSDLDRAGLSVYLEYAGARVVATAPVSADSPLVVILDGGDGTIPKETLLAPFAALPNMRAVLLLTRGRRRRARQETSGMVSLDGAAMRRQSFVQAVAVAVGRAVAEPPPQQQAQEMTLGQGAMLPSIAEAKAQGRLILVAEDDDINQKVILQQLALLGQRAEVADNGAEALRMWRDGDYALLLTDLHMPEMDGYMLAETIRREESGGRRMPILALTANASQGEVHHTIAAGMDEYLTKPIRLQTLQAALSKWLPPTHEPPLPAALSEPIKGEPTAAAVDVTVLQGFVGDDPDTVREFLADYLAAAQRLGAELGAAAAVGDGEQVQAIAHKLKSSSRTIGAGTLAALCASLEKAGQARDRDAIRHGMAEFEAALAAVKTECRAWLTKHEKEEHP